MQVIYRITSIPSTHKPPVHTESKHQLNKLCLNSFTKCFTEVNPKVIFLMDHCDPIEQTLLEDFPFDFDVEVSSVGIRQTMIRSYQIAAEMDDIVLFNECDYLYRPSVGKAFVDAVNELDLVSPYDHPNFYRQSARELHSDTQRLMLVNNYHFRTAERNTMTWATQSSLIATYFDIFNRHGHLDGQVWYDLKAEGIDLWTPIPGFATHMVEDELSPSINWEDLWQNTQ